MSILRGSVTIAAPAAAIGTGEIFKSATGAESRSSVTGFLGEFPESIGEVISTGINELDQILHVLDRSMVNVTIPIKTGNGIMTIRLRLSILNMSLFLGVLYAWKNRELVSMALYQSMKNIMEATNSVIKGVETIGDMAAGAGAAAIPELPGLRSISPLGYNILKSLGLVD